MKNKLKKLNIALVLGLASAVIVPNIVFAVTLADFINSITDLLALSVVRLIFALAFVYFFWGVVQYVLYPDDEGKKEKGRSMMIWGIIALTVMFSVYGLIEILASSFNIDPQGSSLDLPNLPD